MNKLSVYTGIQYCFRNYNCWHHVRKVRADFGMETPEFDCTTPDFINDTFEAAHGDSKGLIQQCEPSDYCAVLMQTKRGSKYHWHSGVYLDGSVSHCDRFARQVKLDALDNIAKIAERVEFWR